MVHVFALGFESGSQRCKAAGPARPDANTHASPSPAPAQTLALTLAVNLDLTLAVNNHLLASGTKPND